MKALNENQIHMAALDVTSPEPLPRDHPLLKCSNCIIVPHWGSATEKTRLGMCQMAIENTLQGLVQNLNFKYGLNTFMIVSDGFVWNIFKN